MIDILGCNDEPPLEEPPSLSKEKPVSHVESYTRNTGLSPNIFLWGFPRTGKILNRSLTLLNLYSSLDS